ncbi:MAG: BTAD domain-containing putative transcriptional regulator [Acidimicrobiia bacterium]
MLFRVLGDVGNVGSASEATQIRAPKQRALLALLSLHANALVSRSLILESLWGGLLPDHPETALQIVVSRLRSELGPYSDHLVTEAGGYRLDIDPGQIDLYRAEDLLRDGRAALANNNAREAATSFESALGFWTGDPLTEFQESQHFREARTRVRELRFALVEARNDAYLLSGRHLEVLADIEMSMAEEPFREHLRAQQVVALYRAGRQVDALRRCEAFRRLLADEVGLDLSPVMRRLERRVLNHDPTLLATGAGFMTALPTWTGEVLPFIGRAAELELVSSRFMDSIHHGMRLVLVEGEPGIGKSRFLLETARRVEGDAIVLAIHVHGAFAPPLHALACVLAEAVEALSDEELRLIVEGLPDIPADISVVRRHCAALLAGEPIRPPVRDEQILYHAARWIAALSGKAPVVLLIDDLQAASASLLHVIGQLAALRIPKRVLIVGSARPDLDNRFPQLARLMSVIDQVGLVERLALRPLDLRDIEDLVERMHVDPGSRIVDRLYELTGGNALLLAELLSTGPAERVINDWTSPPRVRDVVRRRVAALGRPAAELLRRASLFEDDFTLELLADVTDTTIGSIAHLVDRAVQAHVLQPSTLRSYQFAHQLFRQVVAADLPAAQRAEGHRRIAEALQTRAESSAALLAAHWSAASGPDVSEKVVHYARIAGQDATRLFEPNAAIRWFELALQYLTDDHERGFLLCELAHAQHFAGDPRDLTTLREAVRIAVATQNDALTLQIVQVATPGWSTLPGETGPDTRHLLARALEIADDDATRSRVLLRIAVEENFLDPATAEQTSKLALAAARRSGDHAALIASLFQRASLSNAPHSLAERRSALVELLEFSSASNDVVMRYFALSADEVAAIQACDRARADLRRDEAEAIAGQYDLSPLRWSAMLRNAWRAALDGDLEHADDLINNASAFGAEHGVAHAPDLALVQRALLNWQQGQTGRTIETARAAHNSFGATFPGATLMLARALAEDPANRDEARTLFADVQDKDFANLPIEPFWSSALVIAAEAAHILELSDACRAIRDLLWPFTDQVAFTGMWVTAPIAYGVAVAADGCGDPRAAGYLDQATHIAELLRAPILTEHVRRAGARFWH